MTPETSAEVSPPREILDYDEAMDLVNRINLCRAIARNLRIVVADNPANVHLARLANRLDSEVTRGFTEQLESGGRGDLLRKPESPKGRRAVSL